MGTGRVINVVLFASVREKAGCDSLEVECANCTIEELKQQLMAQGEHWQQALQGNILAAVDQEMVVDVVMEFVVYSWEDIHFHL